MKEKKTEKIWTKFRMTRREFLRQFGIATSALTLSPYFVDRLSTAFAQSSSVKVYMVKNGDCFQNTEKLWDMLGGPSNYIDPDDVVVIKGNSQWPNQGYTHTGCIKGLIDKILQIQNFSGEVLICDNGQSSLPPAFSVDESGRIHNWSDHNWSSLADEYKINGANVGAKIWINSYSDITGPADGEGWIRSFFPFHGVDTYFGYPIFESPLTPGRMIDMRNGVWEDGTYTGRKVKAIFMPTLNNHGGLWWEDYAGITSSIKSFLGSTEIHWEGTYEHSGVSYYNWHGSTFSRERADYAGELTARYINSMYAPVLYVTAAMWSGHGGRTGDATETKTVLACENPATLDYVACRDVISPHDAPFLNPDQDNNTRKQILGCISGGVGTINPAEFEIIEFDFENPTVNRLDIDRKIRDLKQGNATVQDVKDMINEYMEEP